MEDKVAALKIQIDTLEAEIDMFNASKLRYTEVEMQKYIDQAIYSFRHEIDSLKSELWRQQNSETTPK